MALQRMVSEALAFIRGYHKRHEETSSVEDVVVTINELSENISKRISRLDEISKDLIQMVRRAVQISDFLHNYANLLISRNST